MATLRELIIKISANSQSFQSEIARASRMGADYYRTMQNGGRQAAAASRESQRALAEVNAQLASVKSTALGMTGALAGAFATGNLINLADQWSMVNARLKQASVSTDDFSRNQAALMAQSQRTGTAFADNAGLFSRSAASLREYGYSSQDALKVTEALATGLKLSGAGAQETSSVITQFSQALAQGVLRGEEFNSVNENGDRVVRALAAGMGVARKDLKAMADQGQLTADKVVPALISQLENLRGEFAAMPLTVSGSVQKVENSFMAWVGGANDATAATQTLTGVLDDVADNIDSVATVAGVLVAVGVARYFGSMATGAYSATAGILSAYKSEVALAEAQVRGTQISTARARAAVYRAQQALAAVRGTDAQAAAEKRLAATQLVVTRNLAARAAAQASLNSVTAVGTRLMSGTLGLVGGLPGAVMLGATAWYVMYQNQEQARQSAQAYAATIDQIREKSGSMSLTEAYDNEGNAHSALDEQNRKIAEQTEKVRLLKVEIQGYQQILANPGTTLGGYMVNHLMSLEDATNGLGTAIAALSVEQDRLSQMQEKSQQIQDVLESLEHRRVTLIRQQAAEQNAAYQSLIMMNGQHTEFNRLLSLGNDLLSARQGMANAPIRLPTTPLSDKQTDLLLQSQQAEELSKLKGASRVRRQAEFTADKYGLTNAPETVEDRNRYVSSQVSAYENEQGNKPKSKGSKTDEEKAFDTYDRLIQKQREQLALTSSNTELAKIKYQISEGELSTLTNIQKQELLRNAALIDQAELEKKAAQYEKGLADSNDNAKNANDSSLTGFGEGSLVRERMQEMLSIRREYIQKDDELRKQHQAGEIDDAFFNRAIDLNKKYLDERLSDQQMYYSSLDDQRNDWSGGMSEGYAQWADEASNYSAQVSQGMQTAMSGAVSSITEMLNGNVDSWEDWAVSVLKIIQNVLVNMAVVNAVSSIGNLFNFGTSAVSGSVAGAGSTGAMGMSTSWQSYVANAKGGVYSSPSLSAYSNSVVSSPTLFAFAKGAGLMGEAGPEAIMPLTRASNGSLGVRAVMPDTSTVNNAGNVYVTINENGSTSVSGNGNQNSLNTFAKIVQEEYRKLREKDLSQNGSITKAIQASRGR